MTARGRRCQWPVPVAGGLKCIFKSAADSNCEAAEDALGPRRETCCMQVPYHMADWSQSQQGAEVACSVGGGVNAPLGLSNGKRRHKDSSCDQRTLVTRQRYKRRHCAVSQAAVLAFVQASG